MSALSKKHLQTKLFLLKVSVANNSQWKSSLHTLLQSVSDTWISTFIFFFVLCLVYCVGFYREISIPLIHFQISFNKLFTTSACNVNLIVLKRPLLKSSLHFNLKWSLGTCFVRLYKKHTRTFIQGTYTRMFQFYSRLFIFWWELRFSTARDNILVLFQHLLSRNVSHERK